jgi:tetratricopeptide (TPR) repeat protein
MKKIIILLPTILLFAVSAFAQTTAKDFYEKGKAESKKGDFKAAGEAYKKAYELDPKALPPSLLDVVVKMKAMDLAGSVQALSAAIKDYPDDAFLYFLRGLLGMSPEGAALTKGTSMADLGKAIELAPGSAAPYVIRGTLRLDKGDLDGTIADSARAIELGAQLQPNDLATAYYNRGKSRLGKKDYDGANLDLTRAIQIDPQNPQYYYDRAGARLNKDDRQGTIADFSKVIELDPAHIQAYINRGLIRNSVDDFGNAIADFTKVIQSDPKNPQIAFVFYHRGISKMAREDYAGALADFTKAIELDPKYADAYESRGIVRGINSDAAGAIADFTRAIQLEPNNAEHYKHRAEQYRAMNKITLAADDDKRAAELAKP